MQKAAHISDCEKYRYSLSREWDETKKSCLLIMLNPSKADATINDPTITRCIHFAKSWGYGSLQVVNLFAYRATQRARLKRVLDPVGEETDTILLKHAKKADAIVCAWGIDGTFLGRNKEVLQLLKKEGYSIHCIACTKEGEPKHPLYLRKDAQMKEMH